MIIESKKVNIEEANEEPKTDTINTPQAEEQRVKLGSDIITKKDGEQKVKKCFKEHKKQSEAQKMAGALAASSGACAAMNAVAFASSMMGINHEKDNIAYHESAYYSLLGLFVNLLSFTHAVIKLKKLKHIDQGKQIKLTLKEKKQKHQNTQNAIAELGSHDKNKTIL